jgi:hypothetical protein
LADMATDYTGIDVVPELVARNNEAFGSDRVRFLWRDITRDSLPGGDVLQHLSNAQIKRAIEQLEPFRYVVVAEHHPARLLRPNLDKDTSQTAASTSIPGSTWSIPHLACRTPW